VLDWSADSEVLAALSSRELRIYSGSDGHLIRTLPLPGMRATDGAFAPAGKSFAVTGTSRTRHRPKSKALLVPLGAPGTWKRWARSRASSAPVRRAGRISAARGVVLHDGRSGRAVARKIPSAAPRVPRN
jgi:hypothetical protein